MTFNACITVVMNSLTHVVFHICCVANSFRYLCAKNYENRTWFDKVIKKIKRV